MDLIDRRAFIAMVGGGILAAPLAAYGQQKRSVPPLCFLTFGPSTLQTNRFSPFFGTALALIGYLVIPMVIIVGARVFQLIDPEMARGWADYTRGYHSLEMARRGVLMAAWGLALVLWVLCCYLVLKARQRPSFFDQGLKVPPEAPMARRTRSSRRSWCAWQESNLRPSD